MHIERMSDRIETERLVLFPYTKENLALFNTDLAAFETAFGVVYRGEELDHLLQGFLKRLESEIADDPDNYLWFTEFLIVLRENSHVIGSIDYKYVPRVGVTEVGYGMNPAYEGRGYMTEALTAFLDFGARRGLRAVRADTLSDNRRSQNVLKRCGFRLLRTEEDRLWWEVRLGPCPTAEESGERPGETAADYIHALRAVIGRRKIILNCAGAVIVRDGKILLQRRSDNGLWGLPGGLLELNETFAQAALREVREETGLEVRLTAFLGIFHNHNMVWSNGDRAHTVGAYYTAEILRGTPRTDGESLELRFFAEAELPELFAEDQRAAVKAFLEGVRLPLLRENPAPAVCTGKGD